MSLHYNQNATVYIDKQPKHIKKRLLAKAEWLWKHRRSINHHPLKSNLFGFYRWRVGDFRIIYKYNPNNEEDELEIYLIADREIVYDLADKMG